MTTSKAKRIAELEEEVSFHQEKSDAAARELSNMRLAIMHVESRFIGDKLAKERAKAELNKLLVQSGLHK